MGRRDRVGDPLASDGTARAPRDARARRAHEPHGRRDQGAAQIRSDGACVMGGRAGSRCAVPRRAVRARGGRRGYRAVERAVCARCAGGSGAAAHAQHGAPRGGCSRAERERADGRGRHACPPLAPHVRARRAAARRRGARARAPCSGARARANARRCRAATPGGQNCMPRAAVRCAECHDDQECAVRVAAACARAGRAGPGRARGACGAAADAVDRGRLRGRDARLPAACAVHGVATLRGVEARGTLLY